MFALTLWVIAIYGSAKLEEWKRAGERAKGVRVCDCNQGRMPCTCKED